MSSDLLTIGIALAGDDCITIAVPHCGPSSWALAHRIAALLFDCAARDREPAVEDIEPIYRAPPRVDVAAGPGKFAVVVALEDRIDRSRERRAVWVERAMIAVNDAARDRFGRATHRPVFR